jgi:hypothetical protein
MSSLAAEAGLSPGDQDWTTGEPVRIRLRRRWPVRPLLALFGAVGLAAMLSALAPVAPTQESAPPAPPPSPWVDIVKPMPFFALSGSEFGREPSHYEARRHRTGGGRADTLTFGDLADERKSWMRLSLYRAGAEEIERPSFFVSMARHAARTHLAVIRSNAPDALPTRFGDFEAADLMLATPSGDTSCLGFRMNPAGLDFFVTGIACGAAARPIDRMILACALDRLDLLAAGEDRPLAQFFAAAEAGRGKACQPPGRAGTAARDNWLDPSGRQPPLRASLQQVETKARR